MNKKIYNIFPSNCVDGIYELYDGEKCLMAGDIGALVEAIIDTAKSKVEIRYYESTEDYKDPKEWFTIISYHGFDSVNDLIDRKFETLWIDPSKMSNRYVKFLIDNGTLIQV